MRRIFNVLFICEKEYICDTNTHPIKITVSITFVSSISDPPNDIGNTLSLNRSYLRRINGRGTIHL